MFFLATSLAVVEGLGATLIAVQGELEWPDLDESGEAMSSVYVTCVPADEVGRMVTKAVARQERRLKRCPKPGSNERWTEKHRARIFANPPRERISPNSKPHSSTTSGFTEPTVGRNPSGRGPCRSTMTR